MLSWLLSLALPASAAVLPRAYSHNDYKQARPLLEALDRGFMAVEADVYLKNGDLLVGHEENETRPGVTLRSLYLDLLQARVRAAGTVHPGGPKGFLLLVELKSDGETTYKALRAQLQAYEEMLTVFTPDSIEERAVTVLVSGNRPKDLMRAEPRRLCAVDGDLGDLDKTDKTLFPLISDWWWKAFNDEGEGELDAAALARLKQYVERAHAKGRQIRFWGGPDSERVWGQLHDAGVDRINTDNLAGLEKFLKAKPSPLDQAGARAEGLLAAPLP